MFDTSPTRTLIVLLVSLLIALCGGYFLATWLYQVLSSTPAPHTNVMQLQTARAEAPVPTAKDYVASQQGFQYLISYTDHGFVPANLIVQKGETVRFTNNNQAALQIFLGAAQSPVLERGQYWEYTMQSAGTMQYYDLSGSNTAAITVQ